MKRLGTIVNNSVWMGIEKSCYALVKFITVPMLLVAYGKDQFGLIALATALHAYLKILSMGLPTGIVKYVAEWLGKGDAETLQGAVRSTVSCYTLMGILNAVILFIVAFFAGDIFNVQEEQVPLLQSLIGIVAVVALISWPTSVVQQALAGAQEVGWSARVQILAVLLEAVLVFYTCYIQLIPLVWFFLINTLLILVPLPFFYYRWRRYSPLMKSMLPGWKWSAFRPIFLYSISLFVLNFAQISVMELRPVIIGVRVENAASSMADYRILLGITQFVLIASSWFLIPLLPAVSHAVTVNDHVFIDRVLYQAPKYIWGVLALPLFGLIVCAPEILGMYVGPEYTNLGAWLRVWLLALSTQLHLVPITSVILGKGNVKPLLKYTYISSLTSLVSAWFLCPKYGVGGVAISTLIYTGMQCLFFYTVFIPRLLNANSKRIFFGTYMPPFLCGLIMAGIIYVILGLFHITSPFMYCVLAAGIGVVVYSVLAYLWFFKQEDIKNIKSVLRLVWKRES